MKTKAVRLYGANDLRLDSFELPEIKDNEILVSVVTDSMCMSSWKLVNQGDKHKKTPQDLANNPIIVGHECCGEILKIGKNLTSKYKVGNKFVVQANLQLPDSPFCVGYSYANTGGCAKYMIINDDVLKQDCLIPYNGKTFYEGSLVEPLSCIIGAFNANYHLKPGSYEHVMGIKPNGDLIILAGTGPMGMLAIDYALNGPIKPKKVVVTGRSKAKVEYLKTLYQSTEQVELEIVDISGIDNLAEFLKTKSTNANGKYDDVFIFMPDKHSIAIGSELLNFDGCLNFFAGPQDTKFTAEINFYDVHYNFTHIVGTSGGSAEDMKVAVKLIEQGVVNVSKIVTHILGLNEAATVIQHQPEIGGGKKIVYTHKNMPLQDITNLTALNNEKLRTILQKTKGIWSKEAEDFVLNEIDEI